eukprot:3940331-Rhodomonas_salina.3
MAYATTSLRVCYAVSGTETVYAGSSVVANSGYWRGTDMSCKGIAAYALATQCLRMVLPVSAKNRHPHNCQPPSPYEGAVSLRACYAMSGTEIAYRSSGLRWHPVLI